MAEEARDQHDLGRIGLFQPRLEREAHFLRGEVLVLDVEIVPRPDDHVEVKGFDVADAGVVPGFGLRARYADLHLAHFHLQLVRPGVARRGHGCGVAAGGRLPAPARERGQFLCGLPVHRDHHVVKRRIGLLVEGAPRIVGRVARRVPALVGDVQPAGKGELVVEHHYLLVMGARQRVGVVEADLDVAVRLPREAEDRRVLPIGSIHHREIPIEDANAQLRALGAQAVQKVARRLERTVVLVVTQHRAAVEIPSEHEDRALGALCGAQEGLEIILRVDHERHPPGARGGAAVLSRAEQAHRGGSGIRWRHGSIVLENGVRDLFRDPPALLAGRGNTTIVRLDYDSGPLPSFSAGCTRPIAPAPGVRSDAGRRPANLPDPERPDMFSETTPPGNPGQ